MEKPASPIELLIESAEAYGKTTYELSKLKAVEVVSKVVTSLISKLLVVFAISLFTFALSIGLALLVGDLLGKAWYGFFIVAAFYLAAGIVLNYSLHKWLKKPISEMVISQTLQ